MIVGTGVWEESKRHNEFPALYKVMDMLDKLIVMCSYKDNGKLVLNTVSSVGPESMVVLLQAIGFTATDTPLICRM